MGFVLTAPNTSSVDSVNWELGIVDGFGGVSSKTLNYNLLILLQFSKVKLISLRLTLDSKRDRQGGEMPSVEKISASKPLFAHVTDILT